MVRRKPILFGRTIPEISAIMLVIGILSTTAVPSFGTSYKERNFDQLARKTLAEVTEAQKYHYQIYKSFISCDESSCATKLTRMTYVPIGVKIKVTTNEAGFQATAWHAHGTGELFTLAGSGNL